MAAEATSRLVCAATWGELRAFDGRLDPDIENIGFGRRGETLYLVSGVGVPLTFARLLPIVLRERPARLLNLGIAGAYPNSGLAIGDIVAGSSEVYGDVGLELPNAPGFQPISDTPFGTEYREPLPLSVEAEFTGAKVGRGCTVNTCTGTDATGHLRERLFGAAFETMEGAAVAHIGQLLGLPVCEVRAVSNVAARRDMRPENIRLALNHLTSFFDQCREANRG